jgi:hypothetical protein
MQRIELIDPIAWVGEDRLLLKDRTSYGLNRRLIARKHVEPDVEAWLTACEKEANGAEIWGWLAKLVHEDFYVLWIVWKDKSDG